MKNLRGRVFEKTKEDLKKAITPDILMIQRVHTIDELIKLENRITAHLRERYGLYAPDTAKNAGQEEFLKAIEEGRREDIGITLIKKEQESLLSLVEEIRSLQKLEQKQEEELEELMKKEIPHLQEEAGTLIGARLLAQAGSLKQLACMASSKIQVLGAEKALFKHLKKDTKPPKFGILFAHPFISQAKEKGKAARKVASTIAKAAKIDYFSEKKL